MFCTKCGIQIKDGYKFCQKCGTPVYVEKEMPQCDENENVDELDKETKVESNPKDEEKDSMPSNNYIPNPLIVKALDIEGVKRRSEEGDIVAMKDQAFRYKMGIGVEKDLEKAEKLYETCGGDIGDTVKKVPEYLLVNILSKNPCINKD